MIPEVERILGQIYEIHAKKNSDYAAKGSPFENFERSAELMSWFSRDEDLPFVCLIGTKLARIATLRSKTDKPNNESLEDSLLDLSTYCILWYASILHSTLQVAVNPSSSSLNQVSKDSLVSESDPRVPGRASVSLSFADENRKS